MNLVDLQQGYLGAKVRSRESLHWSVEEGKRAVVTTKTTAGRFGDSCNQSPGNLPTVFTGPSPRLVFPIRLMRPHTVVSWPGDIVVLAELLRRRRRGALALIGNAPSPRSSSHRKIAPFNAHNGLMRDFVSDDAIPEYATLSHTWESD